MMREDSTEPTQELLPSTSPATSPVTSIEKQELLTRLFWSTAIRLILITLLIGIAFTTYQYKTIFRAAPWLSPLIILISVLYVFSFIELLAIKKRKRLKVIAYIATSWDVLFTSALVIATGGIDSIYTFLYLFVAIEAGFLLSQQGGFIFASLSSIFYGLLVDAQFYRLIPSFIPSPDITRPVKDILVNLITYMGTTFLLGILSAFLGNNLLKAKQSLSASSIDLRHLTNLYAIIVNSIDSGLITLDEHYNLNTMNPAAVRITGYDLHDIEGKKIDDIMPGIQLPATGVKRNELVIKKKDKHGVQIGYTMSNLHDETGKMIGTVIAFQDLTEMKKMEAKLKRSDILATAGRLAASVAHEIRNPLASISGMVQILMEDLKSNKEFEKPLDLIFREVDRINNLITEFLSMSKPVTHIQEGILLKPIVDEVFESVMKRVDYNPLVKLLNPLSDDITIKADKLKIKQVLLNLVLNAIHAIKETGFVTVKCMKENKHTRLSVEDNGGGMDENELKLCLEPFWTTNPGGTGLGLPVVQAIVEQHYGVLFIKSKKGEGTHVEIELPL